MLGHGDAVCGGDDAGDRADIKGLKGIHARAAVFHHRHSGLRRDLAGIDFVDGLKAAGYFCGGRALGAEGGQESPLLHGRLAVAQDLHKHFL